jgi:hypothetical protein
MANRISNRMETDEYVITETAETIRVDLKHPRPYTLPRMNMKAADSSPTPNSSPTPIGVVTVKSNPYSVDDCIARGQNRPLIDLYAERTSTEEPNGEDAQDPDAPIDLYRERVKSKRRLNGSV